MMRKIWIFSLFTIFLLVLANLVSAKDDFRFSLTYQGNSLFGLSAFGPEQYTFSRERSLESYKPYHVGDLLLLSEKSDVTLQQDTQRFSLGLEARIYKNAWLTLSYYQTGKVKIANSEALNKARCVAILTRDFEGPFNGFTPIFTKKGTYFSRDLTEQNTSSTLFARNATIGSRYRFRLLEKVYLLTGLGLDWWQVNYQAEITQSLVYLYTQTGERDGYPLRTEIEKEPQVKSVLGGFVETGVEILVSKKLAVGAVATFYDRKTKAEFRNDLLFFPENTWRTNLKKASFQIFLSWRIEAKKKEH